MTTKPPLDAPADEETEKIAKENPLSTAAMGLAAHAIGAVMHKVVTETGGDLSALSTERMEELSSTVLVAGMTAGVATVLEDHRQRVVRKTSSPEFALLQALGTSSATLYVELMQSHDTAIRTYAQGLSDEMGKRARALGIFTEDDEEADNDG